MLKYWMRGDEQPMRHIIPITSNKHKWNNKIVFVKFSILVITADYIAILLDKTFVLQHLAWQSISLEGKKQGYLKIICEWWTKQKARDSK